MVQKTLNINIYQDPTRHVENFLKGWQQFGTFVQNSDLVFTLIGRDNKTSQMKMGQNAITIRGEIPSESFMLIDALAKACEADKIIEGDVIDKNQAQQQDNPFAGGSFTGGFGTQSNVEFEIPFAMKQMSKFATLTKVQLVLLLIVALPVLIIMIPVVIIVAIYKIIMFKLRF